LQVPRPRPLSDLRSRECGSARPRVVRLGVQAVRDGRDAPEDGEGSPMEHDPGRMRRSRSGTRLAARALACMAAVALGAAISPARAATQPETEERREAAGEAPGIRAPEARATGPLGRLIVQWE